MFYNLKNKLQIWICTDHYSYQTLCFQALETAGYVKNVIVSITNCFHHFYNYKSRVIFKSED